MDTQIHATTAIYRRRRRVTASCAFRLRGQNIGGTNIGLLTCTTRVTWRGRSLQGPARFPLCLRAWWSICDIPTTSKSGSSSPESPCASDSSVSWGDCIASPWKRHGNPSSMLNAKGFQRCLDVMNWRPPAGRRVMCN